MSGGHENDPNLQRTLNLPASLWQKLDEAATRRKYKKARENQDRHPRERVNTRASVSEVVREILQRHEDDIDNFS